MQQPLRSILLHINMLTWVKRIVDVLLYSVSLSSGMRLKLRLRAYVTELVPIIVTLYDSTEFQQQL